MKDIIIFYIIAFPIFIGFILICKWIGESLAKRDFKRFLAKVDKEIADRNPLSCDPGLGCTHPNCNCKIK